MKFPVMVSKIKTDPIGWPFVQKGTDPIRDMLSSMASMKPGDYVSIRCVKSTDPSEKTHLGVYLGQVYVGLDVAYDEEEMALVLSGGEYSPAIYIPDLDRTVFGFESWWTPIQTPDDLREITDEDIENVWYVKALKALEAGRSDAKE